MKYTNIDNTRTPHILITYVPITNMQIICEHMCDTHIPWDGSRSSSPSNIVQSPVDPILFSLGSFVRHGMVLSMLQK